ncbi:site-specific integrase [Enterococcus sp. BWM-S5]|uniref:Site-specific integrase n=1 Tax=Enterococcus larvae TaxID=2794352 RepID=A0ABS4CMS3_9ENTE|nr:site-specific integrase [Enterococcus larvae]MBP1047879.1 site-specific integrase [Enterococcus larvae]
MVKRGENIYKRKDGRWEGRYKKSRSKNGRIIYGYIYGKTYSEAREKLLEKKQQYSGNTNRVFEGTLAEWLDYWLYTAIKDQVKQSTWTSYESKIRNHIIPSLGKKKLHLLEKEHINMFVQQLSTENYSDNTTKNIITILKISINYAVDNGYLVTNPCRSISISFTSKSNAVHALTTNEQKKLEALAFEEKGSSAVIIGLATGMRVGEICGLRWADIDFEQEMINVNCTLQRIPNPDDLNRTKVLISTPKTKSSIRKIPLGKFLKMYLLKKYGESDSKYVVSTNGNHTEPRMVNYHLRKLVRQAGITPIHFHVLRHTFATRCVENGVDISSLSKLLGHRSTKLTLDTYADSLWEKRREAMAVIDQRQFDYSEVINRQ